MKVASRVWAPSSALILVVLAAPAPAASSGLASDAPPAMPPVMAIRYVDAGCYVFSDDATSADRSEFPDDGLARGVFGDDEATFSATRLREGDDGSADGPTTAARLRAAQLLQGNGPRRTLRIGAVRSFTSGVTAIRFDAGLPGEVRVTSCDLALLTPAGPSLVWSRTYRSRAGTAGLIASGAPGLDCGNSNFASWDVRIEALPPGSGTGAPQVALDGGDGRQDVLTRRADGSYAADGMFREGRFQADASFTLVFADGSVMTFCPLDGRVEQGRLCTLADRNGVALTCAYGAAGELVSISSAFGQSLTLGYDANGRLATVTDMTGRFVQYSYYNPGDTGGDPGDLESVSCPQVAGQPPLAGPTLYTYATGNVDPLLDHNLLSVADGAGRLLEEYGYSTQSNPLAIDYDVVASIRYLGADGSSLRTHESLTNGYRVLENDPLGRLTECDFDALHRCVAKREYTGFCTPGTPVTSTSNRPSGPLRASDPPVFETHYAWNAQSLCTRETLPDGTQLRHAYAIDLDPNTPVRERGNERTATWRAPGGAQRVVSFDYLPGFGVDEGSGVGHGGDPEPVFSSNPIPGVGIVVKRNPGSSTARVGPAGIGEEVGGGFGGGDGNGPYYSSNPIPGVGIVVKRNPGSSTARTGSGAATVGEGDDGGPVFSSNPIPGVGIVVKRNPGSSTSRTGSGGTTVGEGDGGGPLCSSNPIPGVGIVVKRNPLKSTARSVGPTPPNSGWSGEQGATANLRSRLNQLETILHSMQCGFGGISVGHGSSFGGGGGGGSDPGGDLLPGNPIGGLTIKGGRNPGGGMGGATGARPGNPIGGLTIKGGRNPGGSFATRVVTSQGQEYDWSYDANGNCLSYRTPIAGGGCDFAYDALGRCTATTILNGPGSRFTESESYDATTGWKVGHANDPAGLDLTRTCQRDALGRIVRCVDERGFDGLTDYDALDHVTQTQSPPLGSGGTSARVACNHYYDAAGLLSRFDVEQRDATGALDAANPLLSSFLVRDARGRLVRAATEQRPVDCPTAPPQLDPAPLGLENFATSDFSFDAAGQCVAVSVPALSRGQAGDARTECLFDERGLPFQCAQGSFGSPSAQVTQYDWDADGACVRRAELSSFGGPDLVHSFTYDKFHRLASCTDPMGNVLTLERDAKDVVTCSVTGELVDGDGASGNTLLATARGRNGFAGGGAGGSYFFGVVVTDDAWTASRFTPGAAGNVTLPPVPQSVTVHRSPAGLVTSVTNDHDTVLRCNYDSAGRALRLDDGASALDVTRDAAGNAVRTRRTDRFENGDIPSEDFTVTRTFDALGRCDGVTDAVGNHEEWRFDSLGRCTQYTDANGFVVFAHWDGAVAGGGTLRPFTLLLEADVGGIGVPDRLRDLLVASGELVSVTDSNGDTTAFTHDSQGRIVRRDDPDGTFEESTGDGYGNLATHKRKDGAIVACDYDRDRRVASYSVVPAPGSAPVPPTTLHYDGLGRCVGCDQGAVQLTFTYDSLGNQLSELRRGAGLVDAGVTRTFDAHGRTGVTYTSGESYLEQRNAFGEIVKITPAAAGGSTGVPPNTPTTPITNVEHVGHRVWRETRADGLVTKHDYRSDGEPPLSGSTDLSFDACVRTVCLDASGAVVQATYTSRDGTQDERELDVFFGGGPTAIGRRHEQTFDPLHRLLHSVISRRDLPGQPFVVESDVTYTRDLEGLRLTAVGGAHPGVYVQNPSFPPADRQAGQYTKWPGGPLRWDDAGNLVRMSSGGATTRLFFDGLSRLVAARDVATGATLATYEYDGLGRRITSTLPPANPSAPPTVTRFLYDGARCIEEIDGSGAANLTLVASEFAEHGICIISRNGSLVYPHGGGPKDPLYSACDGARRTVTFTIAQGSAPIRVYEREDCDDSCTPLFLRANGRPRLGATGTLCGDDWLPTGDASDGLGRWCPETGFTQRLGATFSPDLGRSVSSANLVIGNNVGETALASAASR